MGLASQITGEREQPVRSRIPRGRLMLDLGNRRRVCAESNRRRQSSECHEEMERLQRASGSCFDFNRNNPCSVLDEIVHLGFSPPFFPDPVKQFRVYKARKRGTYQLSHNLLGQPPFNDPW